MSKYKKILTILTDEDLLVEALKKLGVEYQDHRAAPIEYKDYFGELMPDRASFFITRGNISRVPGLKDSELMNHFAGVALVKGPDGAYQAVLDETHGRSAATVYMERLTVQYARANTVRLIAKKGYTIESETEESTGALRLMLVKR